MGRGRTDLGKEKDELGVHVGCVSQYSMAVHAGMLKVDAGFTVRADNDLQLSRQYALFLHGN